MQLTAEEIRKTVGLNIRLHRVRLGLNQAQLAERMNYTSSGKRAIISAWELGRGDISVTKLFEFAEALETTPESLIAMDTPIPRTPQMRVPKDYPFK